MEQILTISIPTYSTRTKIKPHIVYHISITAPVRSWTVQRRYSDFYELNQKFLDSNLNPPIQLPPKSSIFSITSFDNPQFIETRRKKLEEYLQALLSVKDDRFKKLVEWKTFLGISHLKTRSLFDNDESATSTSFSSSSSLNSSNINSFSIRNENGEIVSTTTSTTNTTSATNTSQASFSKAELKASEKWLEDCRDLNLLINEIRTCIAAKNKFISRNETAAACEATILARKNHNILSQKYQALEMELNRQIDDFNSQQQLQLQQQDTLYNSGNLLSPKHRKGKGSGSILSKGELSRRQDLLGNLRTVKDQLEKVIGNIKNPVNESNYSMSNSSFASSTSSIASNNSSFIANQSVYYSSKGNSIKMNGSSSNLNDGSQNHGMVNGMIRQDSAAKNLKSKRKFGIQISKEVEEKTRGMDNSQILQLQKDMLDDQDLALEQFTTILKRQKAIGKAINQELDLQNQLMENLDNDVSKVNVGLKQAEKRMKKVLGSEKK